MRRRSRNASRKGWAPKDFRKRWLAALGEAGQTESEWARNVGVKQQQVNAVANAQQPSAPLLSAMYAFVEKQETRMRARLGAAPATTP